MDILGAMAKAAKNEIKKSIKRKLRKASGAPVKVNRTGKPMTRRKKKLPAYRRKR